MARLIPRPLLAIVLLAATLHAIGIAWSRLPAQDGLKFIRVARAFQTRPWMDVVRDSDQHPLYPALVALIEPAVAWALGEGPDAWRIAAQLVASSAAIGLLLPLRGLTRALFGSRIADLATLGFVLLPGPMAIGHDTLSDSLALLAFLVSLRLGVTALRSSSWAPALGCGFVAGLGFLTRPEVLVVPCAVLAAGTWRAVRWRATSPTPTAPRLAGVAVVFLAMVGGYALVKGEVSEKLALRTAATLVSPASKPSKPRAAPRQWLPKGLDHPAWDFSPKEEPPRVDRRSLVPVLGDLAFQWAEGLGWMLAVFAIWGLIRDRSVRARLAEAGSSAGDVGSGRTLIATYLLLFTGVLVNHERRMGYLSHRHVLTLVVASLPWAAAAVDLCAQRAAELLRLRPRRARLAGAVLVALAVAVGVTLQLRVPHPSRWGHWAAGVWIDRHGAPDAAVLDTRGWAGFVSQRPTYDYWHVSQALTDSRLTYVVVGEDERTAPSRRGKTLDALLAFAAEPVAAFPERAGERSVGVRVYRFHRPESWEGLRP